MAEVVTDGAGGRGQGAEGRGQRAGAGEVQLGGLRPARTKSVTRQVLRLKIGRPTGVPKTKTFL